jgi:sulfate transport system substrate-binding protein
LSPAGTPLLRSGKTRGTALAHLRAGHIAAQSRKAEPLHPEKHERLNWPLVVQRAGFWTVFTGLVVYATWPWLPGVRAETGRTVVVYGFSILGDVMTGALFPAFQAEWERRTGERVEFTSSFAGSGTVTNQIVMGVPAQVAILSLELDAQRLAEEGRIADGSWRALPHGGIVNRTPFIVLVREGNPERIADFADLARPGVGVVHPDPLTSGGAQWAILAEYASALRRTQNPDSAYAQLAGIWRNVVAQASSARAARTQFDSGFGDALITYEQEAIADAAEGELHGEVVYPPSTILSEHLVVVVDRNVPEADRELVDAFVQFLWSEPAQRLFVEHGFRSVDEPLNAANPRFGAIADPFTVSDLGGWSSAKPDVIDSIWKRRVLAELGR